jgi:hypothetical protein
MSGNQNKNVVLRLDSNEEREKRLDFIPLRSKIRKTPQGFARVPAALSRTGILIYRDRDGKVTRELRHPDDVLHPDAVATMEMAPVVVGHEQAKADVSASNYRDLTVGMTSDRVVREDGDETHLLNDLLIQDPEAIKKVNSGELHDISPAYTCVIERVPGKYKGKSYDQRQRFIRYNNFALGAKGWGREGPSVATRLNAAYCETFDQEPPSGEETKKMEDVEIVIRMDGVEYKVKAPQSVAGTIVVANQKLVQRLDAADSRVAELEGELQVTKANLAETQTRLDSAIAPENVEKLVAERTEVLTKAQEILGKEERLDGLGLDEIRKKALEHSKVDCSGLNSDGLVGAFRALSPAASPVSHVALSSGSRTVRQDGTPPVPVLAPAQARSYNQQIAEARDRMVRRGRGEEVKA